MRNIVMAMHTSLDGFVAGTNGEMDWIKLPNGLFDFVGTLTNEADTALYGRITWQMMDGYWPTAGDEPDASKHDKEHAAWYNAADKIVLSRTMVAATAPKTSFIGDNTVDGIRRLKEKPGKNIHIFGSPSASYELTRARLIDEYWLFVNPVLLGKGIPLFNDLEDRISLELATTKVFDKGVIALHYKLA